MSVIRTPRVRMADGHASPRPQSPDSQSRIFGVTGSMKLTTLEMGPSGRVAGSFKIGTVAFKN